MYLLRDNNEELKEPRKMHLINHINYDKIKNQEHINHSSYKKELKWLRPAGSDFHYRESKATERLWQQQR